ncbi:hypothetical protein [Salinibacter altiplanensis]|uniref:hypothetical protein n=1 Tax=Salinibacter altiplanensis TaxID=1803181 RepID=UPI000C9FF97C|nr:hypothetical protein [Salinibacter altiplanensis]
MDDDINYTKEALFNTWNLVFLITVVAVAAGLGLVGVFPGWLPELLLLVGGGAELLYLGGMPRHDRFQRYIRAEKRSERHQAPSQREIFSQLRNRSQRRYAKLRKLKEQVEANYQKLSYASQGILGSHVEKIDGLLDSYLDLLHQRERYRDFMDSATEAQILESIEALKKDMADDAERVRAVKQRRLKVLERRLARFRKAHENLEVIGAQLGTIEDVVRYIHEQSWTLQNPEEVTAQLDTLLQEVEETQSSICEIEDVFAAPADYLDDGRDEDLDALDAELDAATDGALGLPNDDVSASSPEGEAPEPSSPSQIRE